MRKKSKLYEIQLPSIILHLNHLVAIEKLLKEYTNNILFDTKANLDYAFESVEELRSIPEGILYDLRISAEELQIYISLDKHRASICAHKNDTLSKGILRELEEILLSRQPVGLAFSFSPKGEVFIAISFGILLGQFCNLISPRSILDIWIFTIAFMGFSYSVISLLNGFVRKYSTIHLHNWEPSTLKKRILNYSEQLLFIVVGSIITVLCQSIFK